MSAMTIEAIQSMLAGRGSKYSTDQVQECTQLYGQSLPQWYAKLWTQAAIFDTDLYVYDDAIDDEPWLQIRLLHLDGPDDGWKKHEHDALLRRGYFSLGHWDTYAYWLITPSTSYSIKSPIRILEHDRVDQPNEITSIEGIETFEALLEKVVDFPILRAVDQWDAFIDQAQHRAGVTEIILGPTSGSLADELLHVQSQKRTAQADPQYSFGFVIWALAGRPSPDELENRELTNGLRDILSSNYRRRVELWKSAGIKQLPHHAPHELPAALRYLWNYFDHRPHGPRALQRGMELLHSIAEAAEQSIPNHLLVIGKLGHDYMTMDLSNPAGFDDCPLLTWPNPRPLAPSLGDWLLSQLS